MRVELRAERKLRAADQHGRKQGGVFVHTLLAVAAPLPGRRGCYLTETRKREIHPKYTLRANRYHGLIPTAERLGHRNQNIF